MTCDKAIIRTVKIEDQEFTLLLLETKDAIWCLNQDTVIYKSDLVTNDMILDELIKMFVNNVSIQLKNPEVSLVVFGKAKEELWIRFRDSLFLQNNLQLITNKGIAYDL